MMGRENCALGIQTSAELVSTSKLSFEIPGELSIIFLIFILFSYLKKMSSNIFFFGLIPFVL